MRARIAGVEGDQADHLTITTTAKVLHSYSRVCCL